MTALPAGRSIASCAQPSEEAALRAHLVGDIVICAVCHGVLKRTTWTMRLGDNACPEGRWTHDGFAIWGVESNIDLAHKARPLLISDLPPGVVQVWDLPLSDSPALRAALGADAALVIRRRRRLRDLLRRRRR